MTPGHGVGFRHDVGIILNAGSAPGVGDSEAGPGPAANYFRTNSSGCPIALRSAATATL